ncbi:2-oxo-4-hydroxy-4-carboxy-5-ureidoimidazoline decarboxylase [Veronia pacifica]|uniref:2-oxo-4-hydroxy-4-carboxy-5-ureidoimidazoline decarboxylase n=1 Tax=Veronia pacifica TaxID=1080227 RepID=A0A1C3EFZ8_9GAMM|nr:2-oxo-4-hydroxy-4-carboxy-5-ureidoimidazoline decarboxylase [Veronia pacifica]ODA32176.1 OHCU decarboxylase [Veronia pacifica]
MARFSTCSPSTMTEQDFMQMFGGIYEHSPWIAAEVWQQGVGDSDDEKESFKTRMATVFNDATEDKKLEVIKAHPDLAGKAAMRGELTESSTAEQSGAGIDQCSPREFETFTRLNDAYKQKFGFPFIMAVKGANKDLILAAFVSRIENTREIELETAYEEINKIAAFRLAEL